MTTLRKLTLALTATLLLWSAPTAAANQLPRELIGEWCGDNEADANVKTYSGIDKNQDCDGERVTITPSRYDTNQEFGCKIVSVKTRFDRSIPRNNRTLGVVVARINARCGGDRSFDRRQFDMYFSLGQLNIEPIAAD
jgi:hypothetical protein